MDPQDNAVVIIDSEDSVRSNSERPNKRRQRSTNENGAGSAVRRRRDEEIRASVVDLTTVCDDSVVVVDARLVSSKKSKTKQEDLSSPEESGDLPAEIQCFICQKAIENPLSTKCGHLFCYECIDRSLKARKECPKCQKRAEKRDLRKVFLSSGIGEL